MKYEKTRALIDEYIDDGKRSFNDLNDQEEANVLAAYIEDTQEFDYLYGDRKSAVELFEKIAALITESDNLKLNANLLKHYLRDNITRNCRHYIDELFDEIKQANFESHLEKIRESGRRYGFRQGAETGGERELYVY